MSNGDTHHKKYFANVRFVSWLFGNSVLGYTYKDKQERKKKENELHESQEQPSYRW